MGCTVQLWFAGLFVGTGCFLLANMAYEWYTAICKPLLYTLIVSKSVCTQFVIGPYLLAAINITTHTTLAFCLPFCGSNTINHFFCEILAVLKLACGDISLNALILTVATAVLTMTPLLLICLSYIFILAAILRVPSAAGRSKAFSTCSSHLISVTLYYGSILYIYAWPRSSYSLDRDKIVSTFYTVVFPMLNPLIYSLRNKDVKEAMNKLFKIIPL